MEIFGYARISAKDQNLDRQVDQLREVVTSERNIIIDVQSGKDFNRKGYNSLIGTDQTAPLLRKGDLLVITSLDRLGRNYREVREQWQLITSKIEADIRVLDMPLLDTTLNDNSLDRRFIADLVLQILSYVSEKERLSIRERQRQGIDAAKKRGKTFGRPSYDIPDNFAETIEHWKSGKITAKKAMEITGMKHATFYKKVKELYSQSNKKL